jgi:hypothetical protein
MKKVELTHAEVIPFYQSQDVIREKVFEGKGTIINFNIKTRINDRVSNSPVIFEKCTYFATAAEQITRIKEVVKLGNILDIKGSQDRSSGKDKSGATKYYDSIKVREITPVQVSQVAVEEPDSLPF